MQTTERINLLMDLGLGKEEVIHEFNVRELQFTNALAFSPGDRWLAIGNFEGTIKIFRLTDWVCLKNIADCGRVNALVFSPDGKYLAVGNQDFALRIYATENWECRYLSCPAPVRCLLFHPSGTHLICGCGDGKFRVYAAGSFECIREKDAHSGSVMCLAVPPAGDYFATAGYDGNILAYETGKWNPVFLFESAGSVNALAISPGGEQLAAGTEEGDIHLIAARDWKPITTIPGSRSIAALCYSPCGGYLTAGNKEARQQALDEKKAELDAAYAEELKELEADINGKEFIFKEGKFLSAGELKKQFTEKWTPIYNDLQSGYDRLQSDYAAAEKQLAEDLQQGFRNARPVNNLGFSLDPVYDYAGLATAFSAPQFRKELAEASSGCPEIAGENEFGEVEKALLARDILPFLKLKEKLKKTENPFCIALWDLELEYKFQAARYDGNLKGTEVGMVLFYTDLLAKLWTIDYLHCAPDRAVPGFIKNTAVSLSPVYKNEMKELPNVRIWFGAADSGFQFSSDKQALFFSRNATRIYAASSNPLQPGKEVEVSMSFGAAINWWNQHFEAVAQYEQEYERLNQIMKWSLVTSWLFENKQEGCLEFLADVPVPRTYRFPDWVTQRDLKFTRWDKITFLADGYKGAAAEALPILHSYTFEEFDELHTLYGGVSLASRDLIKKRKPLIKGTDDLIRRSSLDYNNTDNSRMVTLKGHAVTISENAALIQFNDKTRMRSRHSKLLYDLYEKRIYYESDSLAINENLSSHPYGRLQISGDESGLSIQFREKDGQLGDSLIKSLSRVDDPVRFLQDEARIGNAFRYGDVYYIDCHGSSSWFKTTSAAKITNDSLSDDFPVRGAAVDGKTPYAMNIIGTSEVNAVLKKAVNENAEITMIKTTKEFDHLYLKMQGKTSNLKPDVTDQEFEKCLAENQVSRISRIDDSLINNQAYADREIADAMEQHGPLLDLCIRKAASQIKNGRTDQINITEVAPVPLRNPEAIKNLLGALSEMGDRNTVYAKRMFLLAKFIQWKDSEIRNAADSKGKVMLQHENNGNRELILTWQFNDKIANYKINADTLDPVFPEKHPLYVAGKSDTGTEFTFNSIQKMAQENKIEIVKLELTEAASNQPALIYADGYAFRLQKEIPVDSSESIRVTDDTIYLLIVKP